jgi:hypothetical protein
MEPPEENQVLVFYFQTLVSFCWCQVLSMFSSLSAAGSCGSFRLWALGSRLLRLDLFS